MPKYEKKNLKGESKPNYYDGNESRKVEEDKENLKTVVNSTAPETRFTTKQQITDAQDTADVKTPATGFNKKTTTAQGSALKQEVASKVLLTDSDYAGISGASVASSAGRSGYKSMSYSGDAGTILGSAANTPVVGKPSRSEGRFDKKLDATTKKINYLASEQVVTEYQNPKPLGESGNEVQGYYGTPKNNSIRSQKSAGGTPASLLVERSADEITRDELIFVTGQYVKNDSDLSKPVFQVEPTQNTEFKNGVRRAIPLNLTGLSEEDKKLYSDSPYIDIDSSITYGNYLNRMMEVKFTVDADGGSAYISSMKFDSTDLSSIEQAEVINSASTNWIIDMNADEIARQAIDAKAGRETEEHWSCLGRATLEPTAIVGLLSRIEEDTGANVFTSYKFGSKAHAYQLNKAAKDGQRVTTPILEMLIGDVVANISSKDYVDGEYFNKCTTVFDKKLYAAGASSLLIALFDSPRKYTSKADILTQPKSLRKAFQVADNNMNQFRLKKEFVAALNNRDAFSTIDRGYDPLLPVMITDKVGLISPLSYARFGNYTATSANNKKYDYAPFVYSYSNRSSNYTIQVGHPLLDGISDFLSQHATKIYSLLNGNGDKGTVTLSVPIHSSTRCFSLWDFIVMYSVPFIQKNRINSMRDVLDYEVNFEYPFNFDTIGNLNPLNAVNYSLADIDSPLVSRQMISSAAISWIMPEFFWCVGATKDSKALTVMPWYFNEMQFTPSDNTTAEGASGYTMDYDNGVMSMPVIRNGVRLSYLDDMYSMSERDIRLCLDRMVRPPHGAMSTLQYNVYKYSQANEGIPCIAGEFTILDYLSTPRELGWFMVAPHGLLRTEDNKVANATKLGYSGYAQLSEPMGGNTSYRLRCYKGVTTVPTEILGNTEVAITRASAFRQFWDESPAAYMLDTGADASKSTYRARPEVGFLTSIKQCFSKTGVTELTLLANQGYFIPFTVGHATNSASAQPQSTYDGLKVVTFHKGYWGRVQRIPMVISPWDTCDFISGSGANYDPYDFAYIFGLAGMMASDYNQDLFNRTNQVQQQGWLYISDPFIKDSPIFKDSIKYTIEV